MLKLWSVVPEAAVDSLEKHGYLINDDPSRTQIPEIRFAYDWMSDQMHSRIGPPSDSSLQPIWAWYRLDKSRRRPVMRRGHASRGETAICLEFVMRKEEVLLSDFESWNCVLNDNYVTDSDEEYDAYQNELESILPQKDLMELEQRKRKSWENVFLLEREGYGYRTMATRI
jgi:hypothetical protein